MMRRRGLLPPGSPWLWPPIAAARSWDYMARVFDPCLLIVLGHWRSCTTGMLGIATLSLLHPPISIVGLCGHSRALAARTILSAQVWSPSLRDAWVAAARGPPRLGMGALLRRRTVPAMWPIWAAVAGFGAGMLWPHARLGGPVPRATATSASSSRRYHRGGLCLCCGIGDAVFASGLIAAFQSCPRSPSRSAWCTHSLTQPPVTTSTMELWLATQLWQPRTAAAVLPCR